VDTHPKRRNTHPPNTNPHQLTTISRSLSGWKLKDMDPKPPDGEAAAPDADTGLPPEWPLRIAPIPGRPRDEDGDTRHENTQRGREGGLWHIADTPQAPSPRIDRSWLKLSDAYGSSYAECRCDDTSHMQSQRHFTLHSYRSNAQRSQSVPSIIVYTLISYATYLSLIIFKIIPHPMTLLTAFPLQVIILHFI
jgi:hypothetical protein